MATPNEISAYISEILSKLGIVYSNVSWREEYERLTFNIETVEENVLLGNGNEALRALTHVVNRFVEHKSGKEMKFSLDVNDHHAQHTNFLRSQALALAERARSLNESAPMAPMNAYDRMVVHETLKDIPGITTESEGEGNTRHIVIRPQD